MIRDRTVTPPTEHSHRELPPSPTHQVHEGFSEIAGTAYIPGEFSYTPLQTSETPGFMHPGKFTQQSTGSSEAEHCS